MSDGEERLTTEAAPPVWPQPGDKLFAQGEGNGVAWVGYRRSFSLYAIAYKEAADSLVDHVVENQSGADLQFYPVAFLYRHYLELRLKQLLISGGEVAYNKSQFQHHHNLRALWVEVRKILESLWPDAYADEMNALEACITEIYLLDDNSIGFRYPITKNGIPTLQGVDRVDLLSLKKVMERVASFLDCASDAVGNILDNMPRPSDYY